MTSPGVQGGENANALVRNARRFPIQGVRAMLPYNKIGLTAFPWVGIASSPVSILPAGKCPGEGSLVFGSWIKLGLLGALDFCILPYTHRSREIKPTFFSPSLTAGLPGAADE